MSSDLVTADEISSSFQAVASQDGDDSALSISTTAVSVQSASTSSTPLNVMGTTDVAIFKVYEGNSTHGNVLIYDGSGDLKVQLAAGNNTSYINNGKNVGIGTSDPSAQLDVEGTFQASGQVTLTGLQPTSNAPSSDDLEAVYVDTNTGILYYQ